MSNPLRVAKGLRIIIAALILFILFASSVVNAQSKSLNYIGDFNGNVEPITAVDLGTDVSEVLVSPTQFSIAGESGVSRYISDLQSGPTGAFRSVVPVGSFIFGIQDRAMVSFSITNDVTPITQVGQGIVRIRCIAESTPSCLVQNGNGGIYARGSQMGGGFCGAASNTMIPGSDSRNIHMYQMGIGGSVFVEGSRILVCSNEFNPGPSNLIFGEHSLDSGFNVNQIAVGSNFFFTLHSNTSLVLFGKCVDDNCSDVGDMPGRFLSKANFGSDNAISIASDGVVGYILLSNGAILGFGDSTSHPFITTTTLTIVPDTVSELTFAPSDHLIAATNIIAGIEIDGTGCSAGQRYVGGVCTPCEEGYFCPTPYTYEFCPNGEWSVAGASSVDQCTACAGDSLCQYGMKLTCLAGQYADFLTNTCASCPSTHYSTANARECTVITAGNYGNGAGPAGTHTGFITCPAGSYCTGGAKALCTGGLYTDVTGASACVQCGALIPGQYATGDPLVGNTQCIACEAGNMCNGGVKTACTGSAYQSTGSQTSCDTCDNGSYTTGPEGGRTGCVTCAAGHSCDGATSTSCSDASYQPDSGESSCLPCASGRYTNNGFLGPNTQCTDCTAGHFCNGTTQVVCAGDQYAATASLGSCSTCAKGSYTNLGAAGPNTACTLCSEGHACNGIVSTSCAGNQFANETGLEECFTCGSGNYTNNGAAGPNDSCDFCPIGHSCNGVTRARCQYGNFADEIGLETCKVCGAGNFTDNGATGPNQVCDFCPLGHSCNGVVQSDCENANYADEIGLSSCKACDVGSYTLPASGARTSCNICEFGYECPNGALRTICDGNKWAIDSGVSACEICNSGYRTIAHSSESYNVECVPCYAGTSCDGTRVMTVCDNEKFSADLAGSCSICVSGKYTLADRAPMGNVRCEFCPVGSFCDGINATKCIDNLYSDVEGLASCKTCDAGGFVEEDILGAGYSRCTPCPLGRACTGYFSYSCIGTHYADVGSLPSCKTCAPGSYTKYSTDYLGNDECELCPVGKYCNGASQFPCLGDTYSRVVGQSSCAICQPGYYIFSAAGEGNTDCLVCPPGYVCDGTTITPCTGNSYNTAIFAETCLTCSAGNYAHSSTGGAGNDRCTPCPVGYVCPDGAAIPCTGANYAPTSGLTTCVACSGENYATNSTSAANDQCEPCPIGSSCNGERVKCTGDFYQPDPSSATCLQCSPGGYTTESVVGEGNNACNACPVGHSCDGSSMTACTSGAEFQDEVSQSTCKVCTEGYIPNSSHDDCDECVIGSICDGENVTLCTGKLFASETAAHECLVCGLGNKTISGGVGVGNIGCEKCVGDKYCDGENELDCPPGSYTVSDDNTGNAYCVQCPIGHSCDGTGTKVPCSSAGYAPVAGLSACLPCAEGSFTSEAVAGEGNSICTICPVGSSCDGAVITNCTIANYMPYPGRSSCSVCPPGSYTQNPTGTGNTLCTKCPIGKECLNGFVYNDCIGSSYANTDGFVSCAICPSGYFTSDPTGQGNSVCSPCPLGSECNGDVAIPCVTNTYAGVMASGSCEVCPSGRYTVDHGSGNVECLACPVGSSCDGDNINPCTSDQFTNQEEQGSCDTCNPGNFIVTAGGVNIDCLQCPKGSSCDGVVKSACLENTFSLAPQSASCDTCNPGFHTQRVDGDEGNSLCTACVAGYACDGEFSVSCSGTYFSRVPNAQTCDVCAPGHFVTTDNGVNIECTICPSGKSCDGQFEYPCVNNTYADVDGKALCETCLPGSYIRPGSENRFCDACPNGMYCPDGEHAYACTGTNYHNAADASSCAVCPPGSYVLTSTDGNTGCEICPEGEFCDGQNRTVCAGDLYADEEGLATCKTCPVGSFTYEDVTDAGNTHCDICNGTFYCNGDEQFDCPAGSFTSSRNISLEGNSECTECPIGFACDGENSTICTGVLFANTTGLASCNVCQSGFFTSKSETNLTIELSGNSNCTSCPQGWYCEDGIERKPCSSGEFTSGVGSDSSSFCSSEHCPSDYDCVGGILIYAPKRAQALSIIFIIIGGLLLLGIAAAVAGGVLLLLYLKKPKAAAAASPSEFSKI